MFELLDRKPAVNYDGGKIPTNGIEGHITLKNVMFHYPSRPKVKVLNGVSFQLPQGKTLALVGPSGCGKSTLICLLERFYDVQGGQACGCFRKHAVRRRHALVDPPCAVLCGRS